MSATRLEEAVFSSYGDEMSSEGQETRSVMSAMVQKEELDELADDIPKIKIGICAMNKKTKAPPMREILNRMARTEIFEFIIFTDETIKNEPVEAWPICDCLISFYSYGFPLDKAIAYTKLRSPLVLNDLEMQYDLLDRRRVYELLKNAGIETPRNAVLNRDKQQDSGTELIELEDAVQIGDAVFQKPFVEKPVDAEDHNVYIYYPSSAGGGSQRLFRKVGSRSSVYSSESTVRRTGSYLYEEFVPTDGTDLKVYTVGPEYAHAEARKSPSLDGKVERDSQGKEIRYPVILNQYEKEIAKKVCELFKQTVCGFDLLRTHGKSYVCDVNGFSFVKTSKKYYDDCAQMLASLILQELAPQLYMPYNLDLPEDTPMLEANSGSMLELRCVVGVIRHGDRTPKQKMKMEVRNQKFISLFSKYEGFKERKLKLKRPKQLQEVLDIARELLADIKEDRPVFESPNKLHQLKSVLEMYGHFSGINRKIQLKYLGRAKPPSDSGHESGKEDRAEATERRKESDGPPTLLMILKWGGELTSAGRAQAEELGRAFRCMYPGGQGEYASFPGCGLLRLHSTYRHDLKVYASDEGRVQMTAAAFAKGFLALEGELTPILVHLVRSDKNTTEMLDTSSDAARIMSKVKVRLHDILHQDRDFTEEDREKLSPLRANSMLKAMKKVQNPHKMCAELHSLVQSFTSQLKELLNSKEYDPKDPFLYHGETLELMTHRWTKLAKDFKLKNGQYDISLIPDLYDCVKYDFQHNGKLSLGNTYELYECAKALADIVIPQEYGITRDEKLSISQRVCTRLLRKIRGDLRHADQSDGTTRLDPKYSRGVVTPHRHVRTRLYFTSESHVHTVINTLRCGKLFGDALDEQWRRAIDFLGEVPELNYMTQIVLMLYEDPTAELQSEQRFHIELHFSPGARTMDDPYYMGSPRRKKNDPWDYISDVPKRKGSESFGKQVHSGERKVSRSASDGLCTVPSSVSMVTVSTDGFYHSNAGILRSTANRPTTDVTSSGRTDIHPFSSSTVTRSDGSVIKSSTSKLSFSKVSPNIHGYELPTFDDRFYSGNEQPRSSIGGHFVDLDESEETSASATDEQSTESSNMSVNITEECTGNMQETSENQPYIDSDSANKSLEYTESGREVKRKLAVEEFRRSGKTEGTEKLLPIRKIVSDTNLLPSAKKAAQRCLFNKDSTGARDLDKMDFARDSLFVNKSESSIQQVADSLCSQGIYTVSASEPESVCSVLKPYPVRTIASKQANYIDMEESCLLISSDGLPNDVKSVRMPSKDTFEAKHGSTCPSDPVDIPQSKKGKQLGEEVAYSNSYPGTEPHTSSWKSDEKDCIVEESQEDTRMSCRPRFNSVPFVNSVRDGSSEILETTHQLENGKDTRVRFRPRLYSVPFMNSDDVSQSWETTGREPHSKPSSAKSDCVTTRRTEYEFGDRLHVKSSSEADLRQTTSLSSVRSLRSLRKETNSLRQSPLRQPLGPVSSLPAIRAVRNLKLTLQSNLVVKPCRSRPGSSTSEVAASQPPVADFWDESITSVASLSPLQTLHNGIPLKQMESYLERLTENAPEYTPSNTPKRNPSKKLALKAGSHRQIQHLDSMITEGLDLTKLAEACEKDGVSGSPRN